MATRPEKTVPRQGDVTDPSAAGTPQGPRRTTGWSRRWVLVALLAVVAVLVVAVVAVTVGGEQEPVSQPPDTTTSPPAPWLSGATGKWAASEDFGAWRGRPVEIVSSWADDNERMTELVDLQPGNELGDWDGALDVAIGAIGDGESWSEAADGAYDDRWRDSLELLSDLRADRSGTTYLRFAHEMNGNWYAWSVDTDDDQAFVEAWRRFRDMQQEVYPEAQLVFCVNRESVDTGMDWREFFPGAEYVDVMAVDYYNQSPYVGTAEEWRASLSETDEWGGPKGLQQHLDFARSVGLPFAVPEWSGNADEGDSPAFIQGMYEFFADNAGDGPGQLAYEIQFSSDKDDRRWVLYDPYTRMPESARAYQRLW